MLTLLSLEIELDRTYTATISGPMGCITVKELVWMADRPDLIAVIYWQGWAVINGAWHCCLSLPGKVSLHKDHPGSDVS